MKNLVPFIAVVDEASKTVTVLKSFGERTFANNEEVMNEIEALKEGETIISVMDYKRYKNVLRFTIVRNDLNGQVVK